MHLIIYRNKRANCANAIVKPAYAESEQNTRTSGQFGLLGVISEKLNYIHNKLVEAGFVEEAHNWKCSSAKNYAGEKRQFEVELL